MNTERTQHAAHLECHRIHRRCNQALARAARMERRAKHPRTPRKEVAGKRVRTAHRKLRKKGLIAQSLKPWARAAATMEGDKFCFQWIARNRKAVKH